MSSTIATAFDPLPDDIDTLVVAPPSCLAREIHIRMDDAHVTSERVVPAESLLFGAEMTPHFLLAIVVDCVFVPR